MVFIIFQNILLSSTNFLRHLESEFCGFQQILKLKEFSLIIDCTLVSNEQKVRFSWQKNKVNIKDRFGHFYRNNAKSSKITSNSSETLERKITITRMKL